MNKREKKWEENFSLLVEYKNEYDSFPLYRTKYKNVKLGAWAGTIKTIYNSGEKQEDGSYIYGGKKLTAQQIKKLNSIEFEWKSKTREKKWEKMYELLVEYKNEYGRFPVQYEIYKGVKIGKWVDTQRTIFNNGKEINGEIYHNNGMLNKDRIKKLNLIDFQWILEKNFYYNKEIKDMERVNRILLLELKKILLEQKKNNFNSYSEVKEISRNLLKSLNI